MKDLIARYVYDVTRRLPEKQREEVSKELTANIEDMLGGSDKESDIEKVLLELGHPRNLSNEYREKQRYLISPIWMDEYLRVLKVAIIVVAALSFIFTLIDSIVNPEAVSVFGMIAEVFGKTISETVSSALGAFAIVTLIFIGIERVDVSPKKREWSIAFLPDLSNMKQKELSRSGSIVGLMFIIIFGTTWIYLLFYHQSYLGIFMNGTFTQAFNDSAIRIYLPVIIISFAISIITQCIKINYARLNLQVAISRTIDRIFSYIALVVFFTLPNLFTNAFVLKYTSIMNVTSVELLNGFHTGAIAILVLAGLGSLTEIGKLWTQVVKGTSAKDKLEALINYKKK